MVRLEEKITKIRRSFWKKSLEKQKSFMKMLLMMRTMISTAMNMMTGTMIFTGKNLTMRTMISTKMSLMTEMTSTKSLMTTTFTEKNPTTRKMIFMKKNRKSFLS